METKVITDRLDDILPIVPDNCRHAVIVAQSRLDGQEKVMRLQVAALRLVLQFHGAGPWDEGKRKAWNDLAIEAGCMNQDIPEATTKGLCDVVRTSLGLTPSKRST